MAGIETRRCPSLQKGGIGTTPEKPYFCQRGFSIVMNNGLPASVKPQLCRQGFSGQSPFGDQYYCISPPVGASQDVIVPADESLFGLFDNNRNDPIARE